ncbi:hypothetical protein BY458DRAFT_38006 [Sporodiniella umbellata]|nr:hypothetical protein BY458DRAFT_38006 [Sporodiniella umbellata]
MSIKLAKFRRKIAILVFLCESTDCTCAIFVFFFKKSFIRNDYKLVWIEKTIEKRNLLLMRSNNYNTFTGI